MTDEQQRIHDRWKEKRKGWEIIKGRITWPGMVNIEYPEMMAGQPLTGWAWVRAQHDLAGMHVPDPNGDPEFFAMAWENAGMMWEAAQEIGYDSKPST